MMEQRRSVALQYDKMLPAPFVVARGKGLLADRLVELARQHDVPILEASALADSLYQVEVGTFIPEPFYQTVAEILAFVWQRDGRAHERGG
ncbi:MAG: EscU/YscU/HrcU family type III secretion system export apparatus switch protein [Spirochaetales bacterium]